jgi:hypothetical protein
MAFTANSHPRAAMSISRVTHSSKALVTTKRATVKAAKVLPPSRDMHLLILQRIVEVLKERREKVLVTMGKTGRWSLKSIISEHIKHFPWLTRHMVTHYIATRPDGKPIGTVIVTHPNNQKVLK